MPVVSRGLNRPLAVLFYDENRLFHLRGAIDYTKLNLKYRLMMALLVKKVAKLPEEQQNAETRAMLETYGKRVDFVDFNSLQPIAKKVKE